MNMKYSFDECILYDNKGYNSLTIQPQNISIKKSPFSATEKEVKGADDEFHR